MSRLYEGSSGIFSLFSRQILGADISCGITVHVLEFHHNILLKMFIIKK